MFLYQRRNPVQFDRGESEVVLQPHRLQPELGGLSVARHVDMGRLAPVARKEDEPIRTAPQDRQDSRL